MLKEKDANDGTVRCSANREPACAEPDITALHVLDPLGLGEANLAVASALALDPGALADSALSLGLELSEVSSRFWLQSCGLNPEPVIKPHPGDNRFADAAWSEQPLFRALKESYLLSCENMMELIEGVEGVDSKTHHRAEFFARQWLDAVAPTNFAATNPAALRAAWTSGGQSLRRGLDHLIRDISTGRSRMVDPDAFEVGVDLAVTEGKVVYQNELMQLIQYAPVTAKVAKRPLLIIPPWINKYYIMDLSPGNSMVRWLTEQGQTVFMISWINPDERLAHKRMDDYMLEGPLAALDAIEQATGETVVNAAGYCLGGILLSATLAFMQAKRDRRIASASLLTTMVDFSEVGDIAALISKEQMPGLERQMAERGYLNGADMANAFLAIRANDLIWWFYVNNYLLGKDAPRSDLLFWNADSTRMPATMHTTFIRNMYLDNLLPVPGGITLADTPIDVTKVKVPSYVLSTHDDHIAPWETTYATTQLFAGDVEFVLGESGHIAGVVNHPDRGKYGFWTNDEQPSAPEDWLESADPQAGSWWPHWLAWLSRHAGGKVPARTPGAGKLDVIENAPGSYVRVRSDA